MIFEYNYNYKRRLNSSSNSSSSPSSSLSSSSSSSRPVLKVTSSSMILHSVSGSGGGTAAVTAKGKTTRETTDTNNTNNKNNNHHQHLQKNKLQLKTSEDRLNEKHHQYSFLKPSLLSSSILWMDGCYNTTSTTTRTVSTTMEPQKQQQQQQSPPSTSSGKAGDSMSSPSTSSKPPTGLVVTLLASTDDRRESHETFRRICKVLPKQVEFFVEPQGLDMLLVIEENSNQLWTVDKFVSCLRLTPVTASSSTTTTTTRTTGATAQNSIDDGDDGPTDTKNKTWTNLDGTNMTATPYRYEAYSTISSHSSSSSPSDPSNRFSKIYISTVRLRHPTYVQRNPSILQQPITPPSCEASRQYIQATRWYTREMLHLGILQDYDYFFKIDTDIIFVDTIPFHLLYDMDRRGRDDGDNDQRRDIVFGHTAQYHPNGSKTCALGIKHVVDQYIEYVAGTQHKAEQDHRQQTVQSKWHGQRCSKSPELMSDVDWYYTNFIIGKVDFWQSREVLQFSNFLNEHPEGFYKHRWTDQIFWHHAMGLFIEDYEKHVVGYTNLRCMPDPNCWYSSYNLKTYGADAWHRCDNNGFFLHPKNYYVPASLMKNRAPERLIFNASQPLFHSTYASDCSVSQHKVKEGGSAREKKGTTTTAR